MDFNDNEEEEIVEAEAIQEVENTEVANEIEKDKQVKERWLERYNEVVNSNVSDIIDINTHRAIVGYEVERRAKELVEWAKSKRLLMGVPTKEVLEVIYNRLKSGKTIKQSIEGVCGYSTWRKWCEEYEIVRAVEEEAIMDRSDKIMEEAKKIADQSDRTKMGEVGRDRLNIETKLKELDRLDRLTENRLNKNPSIKGNLVPIQINVAYANKNGSISKLDGSK